MRLQQALIANTALVAVVTLPLLSRTEVNVFWEWSRAGGGSFEWFRNSGPVVVAEFPGGRLPSMYPRVHLLLSGRGSASVRWSVADPSRLQLSDANPELPIAVSESIPYEKYVVPGRVTGPSEIIAEVGPPHSETVKIPTYTYPVLYVGCGFGASGGVSFDSTGLARPVSVAESDLYEIGPPRNENVSPFYWCSPGFDTGVNDTLHFPGGGRLIPLGDVRFASIRSGDWRADLYEISTSVPPSVLLFRLKDGRIAKVLWADGDGAKGAYLIANRSGDFADLKRTRP